METLATKFWTQATSDTRQGLRPFAAEEHKVSKSALQRAVNGLRKNLEEHPRSAEARALHVDQQSHAQHAAEQAKIEKRKAAEDKRIATRERLKEEQWHYYCNKHGESMGGSWEEYREAVGHAGHLRRNYKGVLSMTAVIAHTKEKYPNIRLHKQSILKADSCKDGFPRKMGRQTKMKREDELMLVQVVEMMRTMKYDMTRHDVIRLANSMLEGTDLQNEFQDGKVGDTWFYRWARDWRHRISTVNARGIEFLSE